MNARDKFLSREPDGLDEILVLVAPVVPQAEANGGIRKADLDADIDGYLDVMVPWNPLMLKNDVLRLYWGRLDVVVDTLLIDSPGDSFFLMKVPVTEVLAVGDGEINVWYERISAGGDPEPIESPRTIVVVKTTVPGGDDPDPVTWPENEGLAPAILPEGPIDAIPPDGIRVEIPAWLNMTVGDKVRLFWGSASMDVPAIIEPEVGQSLIVMVPEEVVEAGGTGEGVVVTYEIRDIVTNWSGRAPRALIDVEVGDAIYDAPAVVEVSNGALDYDALEGDDAQVIVLKNNDMTDGDGVTLTFTGRSYEGLEVTYSSSQPLQGSMLLSFDLPNETIGQVVPGEGSLIYTVSNAGGVNKGKSFRTNFGITGTAVLLEAPRVLEAQDDATLDPGAVPNGATVEIAIWPNVALGDLVRMRWEGTAADGTPVIHSAIEEITRENISAPIQFTVPYSKIGPLGGGQVTVFYTVQSGSSLRASERLTLSVENALNLMPPSVEGEVNGELNPILVPAGARVTIPEWPGMAVGDSVTWFWLGRAEGGQQTGTEEVESVGDIVVLADRGVIEVNALAGDTVDVLYEVTPASGSTMTSLPKTFVVLALEAMLPPPVMPELVDGILDPSELDIDATVTVEPYEGMAVNDLVTVWFGQGTTGEFSKAFQISDNTMGKPLNMYVPKDNVVELNGRTVQVYYTVLAGGAEQKSRDLVIEVHRAEIWPKPIVLEADGDYLPEDAYLRGATMVVPDFRDMRAGDEIDIYWGEGSLEYKDGMDVTVPMDYQFDIPKDVIDRWHGEVVAVRYTITRGNRVFDSEVLNLRIALMIPDIGAPSVVEAPQGVLKPVDAQDGATVSISYEGMTAEDSIQLNWDGDTSFAPAAGNPSGTIEIVVPPGKVAPTVGRTVPVSFTVTRSSFTVDSPVLNLVVEPFLPGNLPMPTVVEQKGGVLSLTEFEGDATARLPAWKLMAEGQRVWWRLYGTNASGNRMTITFESGYALTAADVDKPLNRQLRRVNLEQLQEGSNFTLEAKVTLDGSANESDAVAFRVRTLRFSHGLTLLAPEVVGADDDEIDAIDVVDGVTVKVAYEGMEPTDLIDVIWGGEPLGQVPGDASGTIEVDVDADRTIPYIGKTVAVYYTVTRNSQLSASGVLDLTIRDFVPDELPTPTIPQAANGVLKLSSFTGNATVKVAPWPTINVGQKYWLRCYGTAEGGGADTIELAVAQSVTAAEITAGLSIALPRARLEALRDKSDLRVELKVSFDGSSDEASAALFPGLTVTVEAMPDLVLPNEPMILNGLAIKEPTWPRTGRYAPGNSQLRAATGGVPPYTYHSSHPAFASVDATGLVVGQANGIATITVTDREGTTATYNVSVTNVFKMAFYRTSGLSIQQAMSWASGLGGRGISNADISAMVAEYTSARVPDPSFYHWACSQTGCGANYGWVFRHSYLRLEGCYESTPGQLPGGPGTLAMACCLVPKNS